MKNQHYTPFNYDNRPMVFVGDTYYNRMMYNSLYDGEWGWNCQLVRVEDIENNSQQWFDDHQFLAASSNVATKRFLTGRIAKFKPKYFSVMGEGNKFDGAEIGDGVFIENYNTMICNNITVGNHVTIANYVLLGHNATVSDYCHISSYSFISFSNVGVGACIATRTSITGKENDFITTALDCNFMINSTVTKSIDSTGTYFGNRRVSDESSVSYDML